MLLPDLQPQRLVFSWRPFEGSRHGLEPTEPPLPGQERSTLCGRTISVDRATEVDWRAATCEVCWSEAKARRDAAG
ncbi:zinc finger protein [Saccharopolyspora phatthalungensis]|uniref:zinc finger protein n=1 Tax=Saccharopolyspora phatthalungensis TaxID=664693 RepID=UPI000B300126